ncbi:hypothetical protein M2138_000491 [Dysgonomonadaceae bacterium PH5-43]|nr:hypothetical protein [Dysgonomonadaceae bacterium PH5-43]
MMTFSSYLTKKRHRIRSMNRGLCVLVLLMAFSFFGQDAQAITGSGTSSDPYVIWSSSDLASMKTNIQSGNYNNKYWKLGANITTSTWRIGYDRKFSGTFDGAGYTITLSNVSWNYYEYSGLFARTENAVIKNLGVTYATTIKTGHNSAGLIGHSTGTLMLENINLNAVSKFKFRGVSTGALIGLLDVSGTVSISRCKASVGTIDLIDVSEGYFRAGGLIGHVRGGTGVSLVMKDCHLVGYSFYFYTGDEKQYKDYNDYAIGGLIGKLEASLTMNRCVSDISIASAGSYGRGGIIGEPFSNTYLYNVFCKETALGASIQGYYTLGYDYLSTYPLSSTNNNIWNYLERRDDSGNLIASNKRGNEFWDYGGTSTYTNPLDPNNYVTRVEKGAGIVSVGGIYINGNYSYSSADSRRLVIADAPNLTEHQRVEFVFTPNYQPSKGVTHTTTQQRDTLYLTARVDGKITASVTNIPYPIDLVGTFDQWTKKVTFAWAASNPSKLVGKWYIYKREKESTGAWTRITGESIKSESISQTYTHTLTTTNDDWDKEWEYAVSFVEDAETLPDEPHAINTKYVIVDKTIQIIISSFRAVGEETGIRIYATVPTQLENNTSYSYKIMRSVSGGSFSDITGAMRFDGKGKVEYLDGPITSSCESYTYRMEIEAFGKVFTSIEAVANTTGNTVLKGVKATKGEYSNQVRLEWEVEKISDEADRYKVFRRVANNPIDTWTEIGTVNTSDPNYIFADDKAMPGVYYLYRVTLYQVCGQDMTALESAEDIGFSQSLGIVSGRITYGSGQSVKGVNVSVVRNDLQENESQYQSLKSTGEGNTFYWKPEAAYYNAIVNGNFTYQFWLNPDASITAEVKVAELGNYASLYLAPISGSNRYQIRIKNVAGTSTILTSTTGILPARFSHIALVRNGGKLTCYIMNDEDLSDIQIKTNQANHNVTVTATEGMGIRMGYSFKGNIDECRLWGRALSIDEIQKDYNRILTGAEDKLKAYWTFDESLDGQNGEEGYFFDISRMGTVFNRNHGRHTLISDGNIPTRDQLVLKAITDANGNYQIRGIPFSGEGTSYDIVPFCGVHKFNPTSQLRYVSNNSLVHNSTDFSDVSSFDVSGIVIYDGGNYPVEGCNFEIDGQVVTNPNGTAYTNTSDGSFRISVPIGEHTVRVVKTGHTFLNDGYLTMPEGGYNKNETGRTFYDQTRVKVIGRVVGGLTEYDKPLGFGESVNNTGASTITLTTARQPYDLQSTDKEETFKHNDGQWKKEDGLNDDQTKVKYGKKNVVITISDVTGEFVAWLYPEVYNIGTITAPGYKDDIYNRKEVLDLSMAAVSNDDMLKTSVRTWTDSVLVTRPGMVPYYEHVEKSDTVRYHAEWKTYYQATPTFSAKQREGARTVDYFGELDYVIEDKLMDTEETITLWDETKGYLFGMPVFKQGKKYTFAFEAYEQYKNGEVEYNYPINQGIVNMSNDVALVAPEGIEMNENGRATYTFTAGAPDLTTGKHSLLGTIKIGNASYYWDQGDTPMSVWHLGDKTTGTDFVTSGPDQITAILRDPPGSLSYAYIEKGSTVTTNTSSNISDGMKETMNLTTSFGPKITTFVGLGAGVITTTETKIDLSGGMNMEQTWSSAEETSNTVTFTERFETSDDPLYVGHRGDVFIGNSTNIQYGLTNAISIQKNYLGGNALHSEGAYSIAPAVSLAYGQTFDTRFAYTQVELEEIMIPKWRDNLAKLLLPKGTQVGGNIQTPIYVSNLPHDDVNFGKLNTDKKAFGSKASSADKFHTGPSYTIYFPGAYDMAEFTEDSVMWFNNQINGWIEVLAQNEKEKVEMEKLGNYSFGAGAGIEWSKTIGTSKTTTTTFNWVLNPTIGYVTGADVMGIGMEVNMSMEYIAEGEKSDSEEKEETMTIGFVLKEEGDDDEITVDYGTTSSGTIAFKPLGGRTSCPYEDGYVSKYYRPGQYILAEATMQIEVPVISVNGPDQILNVPSNKTAKFTLDLKNESETGEDVWFQLIVDEETNPYGAELKIDGGVIGNGRMFLVKAGEVLQKTLTVGKGTADAYENIGLILRSECQSDPTTFLPVIADTTFVSVEFTPGCSDVNIKAPSNNWIVNTDTGDVLRIVLDGFERDYPNFAYVKLEYRKTSDVEWTQIMKFYADQKVYDNATGVKTLLSNSDPNITYDWNMKSVDDATYELRATAVCANIDKDGKILTIFSESSSEVATGIKDLTRPEALGQPAPVNGVLTASDEISITFNEDIQTAMLTKNRFKITGLLNASSIADPNTGLNFTGAGYAYTELPISTGSSFSIETWFKRTNNTAGTIFSYGENDNFISLGFDATGHAVVKIGNETQTSIPAINNTSSTWKYIGMSYDRENKKVSVYAYEDGKPDAVSLFVNKAFTNEPPTQGRLYVGNANNLGSGFKGAVAGLHFYSTVHTSVEMSLVKGINKAGTEPNLIGYWKLDEAEGATAMDKARSRHLTLNTDWYIYPKGKSLSFNGTNQYATIPAGEFPFRYFDNFTIEFQFKGASQGAVTLLSVGSTAIIGLDAEHNLILTAGENKQILTTANLLDDNWHQVALSVKRNGMATAIIDGKATASFSSSVFSGDVSGGFYYLGAKYNASNGQTSEYFKGNIDELRVWNSALSASVIQKNKKYKLAGTETGLLSYYPFEVWTKSLDGTYLVTALTSDVMKAARTMGGNSVVDSNVAASVIDAPIVLEIRDNYTYTASNNKIVFNITEELYRIEGVTLEISAEGILDMRGNESQPILWTVYVNKNPLNWLTESVDMVIEEGANHTFKATIQNAGGTSADYYIDGLPSWLSVNAASGTLQPQATKELTFSIAPGINIGNYETAIMLTGTNNVQKLLPVSLKVTGEQPGWSVDPQKYAMSMSLVGLLQIEGAPQEDGDDVLAAFIGDLCVGVTKPIYIASHNAYYLFIDVYGNAIHDDKVLKFKFWDASTGRIYPSIATMQNGSAVTIKFDSDETKYAKMQTPVVFNAKNVIEQQIALLGGWNWLSVNVENSSPDLLAQMKESMSTNAIQIKGQNAYLDANPWAGDLTSVSVKNSYMVAVTNDQTVNMMGTPVNSSKTPIAISKGWNWIGYTPQFSTTVESALAGFTPKEGDQIKAQSGFSVYNVGNGWIGSLTYLKPGKGYMYYSENATGFNFNYPNVIVGLRNSETEAELQETYWNTDYRRFANNMTLTSRVVIKDKEIKSEQVEVAAFVNGECRGNAMLSFQEGLTHDHLGFLMVYGETGDEITFKIYDHETETEYLADNEKIVFKANNRYGTASDPYTILYGETGIDKISIENIAIYPNPVATTLNLRHGFESLDRVEMIDVSGRTILIEENLKERTLDVSNLTPGVYMLRIMNDNEVIVLKFNKK